MKNPDMKLSDAQKSGGVNVAQSSLSYKNASKSPKQQSEVPILKFEMKNIGAPTIVEKPQPMMNYQFKPPSLAPSNGFEDPFLINKDDNKPLFGLPAQTKSNLPPINFKGAMKGSLLPPI